MKPTLAFSLVAKRRRAALAALLFCVILGVSGLSMAQSSAPVSLQQTSSLSAKIAAIVAMLRDRGLISAAGASGLIPSPSAGIEVDQYLEKLASGEEIMRYDTWQEPLGDDLLIVRVDHLHGGQTRVSFWALPANGARCYVFGSATRDAAGIPVDAKLWTSDPQLEPAGVSPNRPAALYPNGAIGGIPQQAFILAVNPLQTGASGAINNQGGTYSWVVLDLWIADQEQVTVPAGTFNAFKELMRVDLKSVLPSVPRFLIALMEQLLPKNKGYFDVAPPHRFLYFDGSTDQGGPETIIELVGYHVAGGSRATSSASSALVSSH